MISFLVILLGCACLMGVAECAGMTSHNVAARRASQFEFFGPKSSEFNPDDFYGLADYRSDAIQAGSPFPDYLYACGDEHDAGEEAHWTPFQIASANYIRDVYPNWATDGRDKDGAGLVAFIMGVTSHYITDINWHGLEVIPSGEGLIRTMGYADFNCTDGDLCGVAHTAADTGGEFVAAASLDLKWFPQKDWFMPTDDLVNIYAIMNATGDGPLVEPQWINECALLFYAGSFGTSRFGDLIYPLLAPTLGGLLLEQYFDFPVGGIDDDAAWTSFMWNRLADWIVNGPPPPDPAPNVARNLNSRKLRAKSLKAKRSFIASLRCIFKEYEESKFDQLFVVKQSKAASGSFVGVRTQTTFERAEAYLAQDSALLKKLARALLDDHILQLFPELLTFPDALDETRRKLDERAENIAHELHYPTDAIAKDTADELDMDGANIGTVDHQYYGTSLTGVKSEDGTKVDILVGSPGNGVTGGPQEGSATLHISDGGSVVFHGGQGGGKRSIASYERFGFSSAACDVNMDGVDDVVVCAPSYKGGRNTSAAKGNYTGRCDVYFGPFSRSIVSPTPDASIYGDKEWGNFGYTISSGDVDGDGVKDLIISAPFAGSYPDISANDRGDLSNQGAVYVFLSISFQSTFMSDGRLKLVASEAADVVLQHPPSFMWFGKSLHTTSVVQSDGSVIPLLLIGSPTFHSSADGEENSAVGRVFIYDLSRTVEHSVLSITGCGHAGRTGQSITSTRSYLLISEPAWNLTKASVSTLGRDDTIILRSGRVVAVPWSQLLSKISDQSGNVDIKLCELLERDEVLFATGNEFEERFGSTLGVKSDDETVVVGAPLSDDGRGRVYSWNLASGTTDVLLSGRKVFQGKGRVGQSLLMTTAKDGSEVMLAGSPYATVQEKEQAGRVVTL